MNTRSGNCRTDLRGGLRRLRLGCFRVGGLDRLGILLLTQGANVHAGLGGATPHRRLQQLHGVRDVSEGLLNPLLAHVYATVAASTPLMIHRDSTVAARKTSFLFCRTWP